MKKLLLISLMLVALAGFTQDIKGIHLGSKVASEEYIETTVAGIEGTLGTEILNDKRVYALVFIPTDRVYDSDLRNLIAAVENKFDIEFELHEREDRINSFYLKANKNGVIYYIRIEVNEYLSPSNEVSLVIMDQHLFKISNEETKKRTSSDI